MPGMAGTGPAAAGAAAPGSAKQGMAALTAGLEMLQKALPQLPMGSKLHTSVLKAVSEIGKHLAEEGGGAGKDPSALIQQLVEAARGAKVNPASMAALPGGAGGPPPMMPPGPPGAPMGM